jgi:hypothetical protein
MPFREKVLASRFICQYIDAAFEFRSPQKSTHGVPSVQQLQNLLIPLTVVLVLIGIFLIVVVWMIFEKAGQPGWYSIIPIWSLVVWCRIAGKPGWWWLLFCIPCVNVIVGLIHAMALAESFGKSTVFGIFGIFLFPYIGLPMLAFGAEYVGPGGKPRRGSGIRSQSFVDDEDEEDRPRRRRREDDDDDDDDRPRRGR